MLNIERYEDDLKKFFNDKCDNIAVDNNKLVVCDYNCHDCSMDICGGSLIDWMLKEYKNTDDPNFDWDNKIDWKRVPMNTPVEVWCKDGEEKVREYFNCFLPNAIRFKYVAFFGGRRSDNAYSIHAWSHCRLVNKEDIKKYLKD